MMIATASLISTGFHRLPVLVAAVGCGALLASPAQAASPFTFTMVPSNAACTPRATAEVTITSLGFAEKMTVTVKGLKPGTKLDLFAIQEPKAPFGVGWYVGDVDIDQNGKGRSFFVGRFSVETFAVAVGAAPVPVRVHDGRDATGENPPFAPIHTFHLGLWFNSPKDATANGCPNLTTPFNGDHTAGVQALNTGTFPDRKGPLRNVD
jgi:hypothetical protein